MTLPRIVTVLAGLIMVQAAFGADPAAEARARRSLHQQQLQDSLDLSLQQSLARSRAGLATADAARLEQLALRQRLEQQQLGAQQLVRQHRLREDAHSGLQHRLFAQERELQLQQFNVEQQRLLQSMKRAPLQPPRPGGTLVLP